MSNSNRPSKPRKDFPLFPHATGRWCKKVRGSFAYFGKVADDPRGEKALELWLEQRDDLLAGRKPRPKVDALTVDYLVDQFLHAKMGQVTSGELSPRTWAEYRSLLTLVVDELGRNRDASDVRPEDWAKLRSVFSKRWGPSRLANAIINTRCVWKWAFENRKLAEKMVFGSGFSRPSAKIARAARNAHGLRMFEPQEILSILDVADVNFRAMMLLAINTAMGPTDLAMLPTSAVNLESGWLDFPRRKTGVARRVPLWPETLKAIQEVIDARPEPKRGYEGLLFLDGDGKGYAGLRGNDAIGRLFRLAAKAAGVEGRCMYDARRSFLTIGERAKDPVATSAIMGHVAGGNDMSAVYRQRIDDERLVAVVAVVRLWLFGQDDAPTGNDGDGERQEQADIDSGDNGQDAYSGDGGPVLLAFCCSNWTMAG